MFLAVYLSRKELDAWLGKVLLGLLLAVLVFAPVALGAVYANGFVAVQSMVALALVLWGVRLWIAPRTQLLWTPLCWVVLGFWAYAAVWYARADIEYAARLETLQMLVLGSFFFLVLNHLYRQEVAQILLGTLVALATILSFLAIYQVLHHVATVWGVYHRQYVGRAVGTYYSPNNFSCLLELLIPLVLAYLLAGRLKVMNRVLLAYGGVMLLAGLVLSLSRGGWMATAAGVVTTLLLLASHRHHRLLAGGLLVVLLGAGLGGGCWYLSRNPQAASVSVAVIANPDDKAADNVRDWIIRKDMWRGGIAMWRDHPWFGVGPGHFTYRYSEYRPERMFLQPEHAHNEYVELLSDWGVAGALLVLAGLGCFIAGLVETWPHVQRSEADFNRGNSNRFAFYAGACGALTALLVHSVMDFNLHIPANALIALTWLALLTSNLRFATERYWVTVGPALRWLLTVALIGVVVILVGTGQRRVREAYWLARADRQETNSMSEAYCVQRAADIEPKNFLTWNRLGEVLRANSFMEPDNYVQLGELALTDYRKSSELNPYYAYNYLYSGMTLDWIGRSGESRPFFQKAEVLDPNSSFVIAGVGWHFAQVHDFAAALEYSERARRLNFSAYPCAGEANEREIQRRLLEEIGTSP